jgi:hypothetical protein
MTETFVPGDFDAPIRLVGDGFRLEPLGPEHNELDHVAWMSSIDHIHATPGFEDYDWPMPMSLADNLADLERHASDFRERIGFTYSVLDADEVIGCVYIYPPRSEHDASVRSWVRESRAEMDVVLWRALSTWLGSVWPFSDPDYPPRT